MSILYNDAFAFYDENKLLGEPIFKSDLKTGHFNTLWVGFIENFVDILYSERLKNNNYPLLKKFFIDFQAYNLVLSGNNSFEKFVLRLRKLVESDDVELKNEFYKLVSELEEPFSKDKLWIKREVRSILWVWNWIDLAQYQKWISWNWYNAKLNWLLNWFVSYNQGDKEKTLWQELDDDIKTISERVNNITLKRAINEKGIIIDDRVVIYSALDWYSPWEVFLEIDWKIISRHK